MYPNTPEMTQKDLENIQRWLEWAGKPGKGCRSGLKKDKEVVIVKKESDSSHNASILRE
jgi:hypothetical protein